MTTLLIAGQDYPRTYREFVTMFPNNEACASYLQQLRWPKVFVCPACSAKTAAWSQSRSRLLYSSCRHQTTVTAGTVFDRTRTPLTTWFEAAWHLTTAKNGMSAKTLQKTLGTSYRMAWTLWQRCRVAMVRADRKPLSGDVEVDETFVGGVEHGAKRGRGAHKCYRAHCCRNHKQSKGFCRIRMRATSLMLLPIAWCRSCEKLLSLDQLLSLMVGVVTTSYQLMGTYELNWYCLILTVAIPKIVGFCFVG